MRMQNTSQVVSALLSDFSKTGSFAKMSRWEKWRSCFFLNHLFNCEIKYFESLLHQGFERRLWGSLSRVQACPSAAEVDVKQQQWGGRWGGEHHLIDQRINLLLLLLVGLYFDCLLRWIRALARTPCSAPCPDWCAAGTSAARLLPAEAPPIGGDWVWFWQLPLNPCSRFDNLRDQIQEKEDDSTKYKYDNTTSQECNDLIESMESSRAIRFVLISVQSSWRVI